MKKFFAVCAALSFLCLLGIAGGMETGDLPLALGIMCSVTALAALVLSTYAAGGFDVRRMGWYKVLPGKRGRE